ncbi:TetR/AcrR family transcriptional regulator [Marinobacterium sp. YM272]|uniref:TetR/AcrR family transcriptional regulator n=1 Tax=Marinobacterium sp. YM272 TaxID=3421654 RepID=UPI003D7F1CB2
MASNAKPATQARSAALQAAFLEAGFKLLNETTLDKLSVNDIAQAAGSSVGGFYSRFKNKEAFYLCLRDEQVKRGAAFVDDNLPEELLQQGEMSEVIAAVVDTYRAIFTSSGRGVLRTTFMKLHEDPDMWEPMRASGRHASDYLSSHLGPRLGPDGPQRARFAVQVLMSVLVNDLVNPNHPFKVDQPEFRNYLIDLLTPFLASDNPGSN